MPLGKVSVKPTWLMAMLELLMKAARRTGDYRKLVVGLEALLALEPGRHQLHKAIARARARLVEPLPRV